jgi:hypothetical protein
MALRTGTRFAVRSAEVFPQGCVFIPGSISEVQDFDENTRARTPSVDKVTGLRVWQVRVQDNDETIPQGRSHEVVVKILADQMPQPPVRGFDLVDFDGLMVTPYVTDRGRMAYSFRATAVKAARPVPQHEKASA